ncbi:TatD DNase family protein [Draconibacterium orientale]|jgi:TatD DNase family protein|uniref:Hydrolase TatD n=1 Tax=Draconibacterium orientale TaxID=1168034 RepID=X5DDZ3_9BACT|nr:TatD family hydrolase [Draconibacterium orientale]AHW59219.1 hydrolase TatD [Draconibacterium orientale]SET23603.1 TatD DNase family protein [Draconibacterium orientale]
MLIDTHSHIYSEDFIHDRDEALKRADESGVKKIILPNIDSGSIKHMLDLAGAYPNLCFPLIGLHPTSVEEDYEEELEAIEYWLQRRKFYGIGEIGIDLYWESKYEQEQKEAFRYQIRLAKKLNLPIVVHVRKSFDPTYEIIKEEQDGTLRGVFHCFSGTVEEAQKITELGFLLGIGGVVTFKNSDLDEVIKEIDPHHLVLETDSPYLAPVPKRGKRNESSYLIHVAQKVADVYRLPLTRIAEITTTNARNLFGI